MPSDFSVYLTSRLTPGADTFRSFAAPPIVPVTITARITSTWRNVIMVASFENDPARGRLRNTRRRQRQRRPRPGLQDAGAGRWFQLDWRWQRWKSLSDRRRRGDRGLDRQARPGGPCSRLETTRIPPRRQTVGRRRVGLDRVGV